MPEGFREARPKRLRFLLFRLAGRVVGHARNLWLKLPHGSSILEIDRNARLALAALVPS